MNPIDRRVAVDAFADLFNGTENTIMELTFNECKSVIDSLPTADVVEVVRCKDCKEYMEFVSEKICMRIGSYYGNTKPNDFCSYGERREDAEIH